jgi:hypothetical protein
MSGIYKYSQTCYLNIFLLIIFKSTLMNPITAHFNTLISDDHEHNLAHLRSHTKL